jgi:hypothetical protein
MLRAMSLRGIAVSVVWTALAATGCAYGEVRQVVRAQFASELNCPEVTITKRDAWYAYDGPHQWKVSGCGVMRTYTCPKIDGRVSYDEPACTWVEGDADAPQMSAPRGQDPALDESEGIDDEPSLDDPTESEPDDDASDNGNDGDTDDDRSQGKAGAQKKVGASGSLRLGAGKKK